MARTIRQSDFEKKDFMPQDLIEKLTTSVGIKEEKNNANNPSNRPYNKGFVPRPYLLKFENAIEQIRALRNEVDEEIRIQTTSSKDNEANYKSQLSGFMTDLQKIMQDFRFLDGSISKVSQTAIRIGDRLENVEDQRQQILDSEALIGHFLRFNKDPEYRDIHEMFYKESGEDLYKAARLIIKLNEIGNDLTMPETKNARDAISNIAVRIKKNLKEEFVRAYMKKRDGKDSEMRECATILGEFDDQEAFDEFLDLYLRDVDFNGYASSSFKDVNKSISQFMNDLSTVIETATKSIMRVFPKPELVIKDLIIKVFRDKILRYLLNATQPILLGNVLDTLGFAESKESTSDFYMNGNGQKTTSPMSLSSLNADMSVEKGGGLIRGGNIDDTSTAANLNKLSKKDLDEYLSIINVVYKNTNDLLRELKDKLLEIVFSSSDNLDDAENRERLYSVRHILEEDKLLKIVFEQHSENYLKLELKHLKNGLKELIKEHVTEPLNLENHLSDDDWNDEEALENEQGLQIGITHPNDQFEVAIEDTTSNNNKILQAFKSRSKQPAQRTRKMTSHLMQQTRSYSQKKLKTMKKMIPKSLSSKEYEQLLGRLRNVFQFGINTCVAIMKKKVSISLSRCKNISSPKELSVNIHKVFLVYLDAVDLLFRKTLIPICKETLPKKGVKGIQNWYFLQAVQNTNSALQLVEQCFELDVAPSITDTFEYSKCKVDKNNIYVAFQHDILLGLKDLLSIGLNIIEKILKEQDKKDFNPKVDENPEPTKACKAACQFIDQFRGQSMVTLDGRNLDRFFLVLGTRLYYSVIQHFRRFNYNSHGAMILLKDAQLYQSTVNQFHIERINELFLTLVERTTLISIPAASIVPYIDADSKLSKIDKSDLKQWLKLRTDYRKKDIERKLFE